MNPETNKFERLQMEKNSYSEDILKKDALKNALSKVQKVVQPPNLLRPDGTSMPKHWSIFEIGKNYEINNYTFKCAYIGETSILFEPVGPIIMEKR